jgi:hydroxymethylbilane synthase
MHAGDEVMTQARVRIGTRGSPLALAQAHEVRERLIRAQGSLAEPGAIEILVIKTMGDAVTDRTLSALGGKGLFTKELEQALLDDRIDIAVHSMKDVPTLLPDGLALDCFLPRADPRDAFFAAGGATLETLPAGAVVGTASLRRQALVLLARPDLRVAPIRGNVDTRLKKVESGTVDATLLAVAGLQRLGRGEMVKIVLPPEIMLPAVAQGAIGIQRRNGDERIAQLLQPLNDPATATRVTAERALLEVLDGSCRTPIAALATLAGDRLSLTGLVVRPDGSERHQVTLDADASNAATLGAEAGAILKSRAGPDFLSMNLPEQAVR